MENADLIRSDTDTDIWQRSPFEQCPGEFWNPADPTQRYAGTFRLEMGLPFVEIPRLDHTRLDWETGILYGIFSDSREVIMIAHEDRKYPVSVYRGDIEFYRYQGLHALIGEQAVGFYAETTLQKVTLVVQPISNWMSRDNSAKTQIGSGFYKPTEVPRITACVESEPRLLTIDLGEEKPLKSALTILDEAQYLARRAIGCLSGKPPVARNYTVQTVSGLTFEWHFARWEAPMREPISTDMRMYLSELGPTETLLNRFATVEQDLRPLTRVLFGAMLTGNIFAEHRFMSLIAGVEGAHEGLFGKSKSKRWEGSQEEQFEEARAALRSQLVTTSDKEVRQAFGTAFRNERTMRQKLCDVLEYLDGVVEAGLQIDRGRWIKYAHEFRNSTAHTGTKKLVGGLEETTKVLRGLNVVAEEILRQILLKNMGVSKEEREWSVRRTRSALFGAGSAEFFSD